MPFIPSSPTIPPHKVLSASKVITFALGDLETTERLMIRRASSLAACGVKGKREVYQKRESKN